MILFVSLFVCLFYFMPYEYGNFQIFIVEVNHGIRHYVYKIARCASGFSFYKPVSVQVILSVERVLGIGLPF